MCFNENNLIWIDLETTSLDFNNGKILEISVLITDCYLNIISIINSIVIHQKDKYLNNMDKWNLNIHSNTGLIKKVKNSKINVLQAENLIINFLKKFVPKGVSPICGNTVAQDRKYICKYMPLLESYFNYRHIDVSTIKELLIRWIPNFNCYIKLNKHIAFFDIIESVYELIYYRSFLYLKNNSFLEFKRK